MSEKESTLDIFLRVLQKHKDEGYADPDDCDDVRDDVLKAQAHLNKHGSLKDYKRKETK